MKYSRTFQKKVANGVLIYNSRPFLPFAVKVSSILVEAPTLQNGSEYDFELSDLGRYIVKGSIENSRALTFDRPLRVGVGKHEFRIEIAKLPELTELQGRLTINYSLMM
ncbi:hypothetical protein CQ062_23950 [Ochrobactrum sp. MYb68]|nr:hypothetical protein CQ062_23950 [Ochrobactrum sp. MYb68]